MTAFLALAATLAVGTAAAEENARASWTIFADRCHTAPGELLENVLIRVDGGEITALSPGVDPPGDEGVLRAADVTAGMIDASLRLHTGPESVEQSGEVQPHRRVAAAVDIYDPRWRRQLVSGVTAGLVTPADRDVIGGLGIVLKTGGGETLAQRTLAADAVLRGAIGSTPSDGNFPASGRPRDFYTRRPMTRMGVEWEWRHAFYEAAAAERDPERDFPGADVLRRVLRGELVLDIEAWTTQDLRTAVFLKEELAREGLGEVRLVVDAAAEAWIEPALLERSGTGVVLPPFSPSGRTGPDHAFLAWNVARVLADRGVTIALSSHGAKEPAQRLGQQAAYAMRGGLSFDEALAAVTLNPARMLGVDGRVGTVEIGKDADLALWSGTPFEPTSRIVGVLVDGELALDPRESDGTRIR